MQRNVNDILTEWFYRLPNGYAIKPYNQDELHVLKEVLIEQGINAIPIIKSLTEDDFQLDQAFNDAKPVKEAPADDQFIPGKDELDVDTTQSEEKERTGTSTDYDEAIKRRLQVQVIPMVKGKYSVPNDSGPLVGAWQKEDIEIFEELWAENNNLAIIGKGEIALYWLFNFQQGSANRAEDTTQEGSGAPDLRIDKKAVEVKSYPSHSRITGLGRWSDMKLERRIVQNIFGIHALTKAFKEGSVANPITEITFGKKHIVEAGTSLFTFLNLPGLEKLEEIFGSDSIFTDMIKNANSVFDDMEKSFEASGRKSKVEINVNRLSKSSTPDELAVQVLQMLAANKYGSKPGQMGYIANVIPGKADVHFHKIDITAIDSESADALNVSGGSIKGNLKTIFG